jgi:HPt (histidine-containing phosphotransfer) domain-containing protein
MCVSDPEEVVHLIRPAWSLLGDADEAALQRLALIARDYRDSRAREGKKATRPDARKTLDVLAISCRTLARTVHRLEADTLIRLACAVKQSPELRRAYVSPSAVGRELTALASFACFAGDDQSRGGSNEAAHEFKECAGRVGAQLLHLPMDCEWLFYDLQQYARLIEQDWASDEALRLLAERLSSFSAVAAELMKSDRGPRSDHVIMRTVEALKVEFERAGHLATHSCKTGRLYAGVPTSQLGIFVESFFSQIEPNARERRGISDALEHACWPSRRPDSRASNLVAREKRIQRITELLEQRGVPIFPPPN